MKKLKLIIAGVSVGMMIPLGAQAFLIDGFDFNQSVVQTNVGTAGNVVVTSGVVGGERDILATINSGTLGLSITVNNANNGLYSFSADSGVDGFSIVTWDGVDGDPFTLNYTGLGGMDFAFGGNDAFLVKLQSTDLSPTLTFWVYSSSTQASSYALSIPALTTNTLYHIPYLNFTNAAGFSGPTLFGSVGAMQMRVDGPADLDLRLDFIQTIPEPSSVVLMIGGLAGLSCVVRRRLKK